MILQSFLGRIKRSPAYLVVIFLLLSSHIVAQAYATNQGTNSEPVFLNDFAEYWGAARLQLSGGNPYSPEALLMVQREVGWTSPTPQIMWNPPWVLSLIMPFGLINYSMAQFFWLVLTSLMLVFCAQKLWTLYDGPTRSYRWAWIVTFSFAPTIFVLILGQITTFVLLGLVGFLHFEKHSKSWRAGAALALVALKPQLAYLVGVGFVFWAVEKRRWRALAGAISAVFGLILVPLWTNPSVIGQYIALFSTHEFPKPFDWASPTFGSVAQVFFGIHGSWFHFVPSVLGLLWFIIYWINNRREWSWIKVTPLLLLVSLATSPFSWTYDQIILLPCVIQATVWIMHKRNSWAASLAAIIFLVINLATFSIKALTPRSDFWFFWLAPTWLLTYLIVRKVAVGENTDKMSRDYPTPVRLPT